MDDEQEDARVKKGIYLAELMWWSLAKRIVRIASEHYKWDDDHLRQISDIFLRPNDYKVNVI
jgi:hypothetical protein